MEIKYYHIDKTYQREWRQMTWTHLQLGTMNRDICEHLLVSLCYEKNWYCILAQNIAVLFC